MTASLLAPSIHALNLAPAKPLRLLCWRCADVLCALSDEGSQLCANCRTWTVHTHGVWRSISPLVSADFERFVAEYEFIRSAEGRGSIDPTYYRSLPFKDITGKLTDQWKIRALTFRYFTRHILNPIALRTPRPLRILDLGAGNGWLSYRLAQMNHQPVAVDLLTNDTDGLGAAIHYKPAFFPRVQATLTQLPFEDQAFDLALFNASFHYAEDLVETLAEALRCLAPGGTVVIADSPWYKEEADGRRMLEEKRANFRSTYGFASNSIRSAEFLTPQRLAQMADALDLKWKVYKPFYGLDWALRPLRARLNRRRTPSHFRLFVAQVKI